MSTSAESFLKSERLRAAFAGSTQPMVDAERRGELIIGGSFLVAALALVALGGVDRPLSLSVAALYVVALAGISRVRIDIGAGFTVPTQVVFVPMLFAVPVTLVPALVALSLALGMTPGIMAGKASASRLLAVPANSWFAVGPCVVLLLGHDVRADGQWGILVLALAAQFACDFAANGFRESLRGEITGRELAREVRQIYVIDLALTPVGLCVAIATASHQWVLVLMAPLFGVLRWLSKERRARMEQLVELNDAYRGTALLLGDVIEADDSYTGAHCKDVVHLALDVATEMGLDAGRQRHLEFAALLHDIGKIAVPKEIVNKPGKLDPREWEIIKTHTLEGQRMLERVGGFMREVGEIVRSHHERWDGNGYPDRLRGEQIPLEARIVSCCDTLNAMTTTRSYRKAVPIQTALAELTSNAGSQFDPDVVDALLAVVGEARPI